MSKLPTTVAFGDQTLRVVKHAGQPWLTARDLARALGYADTSNVTRIYDRHWREFGDAMSLTVKMTVDRGKRGRMRKEVRIFSPRGCHLIAMCAHTPRAADFRRWVLDVLEGLALPSPPAQALPAPQTLDDLPDDEREFIEHYRDADETGKRVIEAGTRAYAAPRVLVPVASAPFDLDDATGLLTRTFASCMLIGNGLLAAQHARPEARQFLVTLQGDQPPAVQALVPAKADKA